MSDDTYHVLATTRTVQLARGIAGVKSVKVEPPPSKPVVSGEQADATTCPSGASVPENN